MRARRSVRSARAAALCVAVCVAAGLLAAASPGMAKVHVKKGDPVIAAAGNIACDPTNPNFHGGRGTKQGCRMRAVSNLLLRPHGRPRYRTVLALGDTQYTCGGLSAFRQSYRPSWGRVFSVTRPVVGDKDYRTTASAPGATGCSPPPGAAQGILRLLRVEAVRAYGLDPRFGRVLQLRRALGMLARAAGTRAGTSSR